MWYNTHIYIGNDIIQHIIQLHYSLCHRELLEHARLHGEELAAMHQQNMDFPLSSPKSKQQQISISEGNKFYKLHNISNAWYNKTGVTFP